MTGSSVDFPSCLSSFPFVVATIPQLSALSCSALSTFPIVVATIPHCHLDRRERSHAAIIRTEKGILENTRFLASLRNDSGGWSMAFALPGINGIPRFALVTFIATHPCLFALSCSALSTFPIVVATIPHCHLDRRERSHAAIIRTEKGILGNTRFLASLRNDSGGWSMAFALPGNNGIPRFALVTVIATHPCLFALSCSALSTFPIVVATIPQLSALSCSALSTFPFVVATIPRCHLDRRERSQTGREVILRQKKRDFSLSLEMTEEKTK